MFRCVIRVLLVVLEFVEGVKSSLIAGGSGYG